MSKYRKFYVALAGFLAVVVQVTTDGVISAEDIGLMSTALIAALAVFGVPNEFPVPPVVVDSLDQAKAQVDAAAPVFDEPEALDPNRQATDDSFWADGRPL